MRAHAKENACGCAGVFSAHAALELYAEAFEAEGILSRLPAFASEFGADFYRLPRNEERITLLREPWSVPAHYPFGAHAARAAARGRDPCLARAGAAEPA